MLNRLVLITAVCLLAACGKSADDYVGYWREQQDRGEEILEIKKENGNYFAEELIHTINFWGQRKKPIVLDEKDGILLAEGVAFKLSEDGKTLYSGERSYVRIDAGLKEKIMAHEPACEKLSEEYKAARDALWEKRREIEIPLQEGQKQLEQQYQAKFTELQKEIRCNGTPLGIH